MIYACLKTMRQWNTALTPANYILLGLATGGVLLTAFRAGFGGETGVVAALTLVLLVVAAFTKAVYYFWIRRMGGPTINTATTFTRAAVRLLDTGHTAGTFLTDEFGYVPPRGRVRLFKTLVFVLGFLVPLVLVIVVMMGLADTTLAALAVISAFIGNGLERWLFFAEARHVVNLYHGAQHT